MANKRLLVWFEEVGKDDVGLVGGKGANLGEMVNAGLPIPYGFIVTSNAYFDFIKEAKLDRKIKDLLSIVNYNNQSELHQVSKNIKELIIKSAFPELLAKQIIEHYEILNEKEEINLIKQSHGVIKKSIHRVKHIYKPPLVAVRSSATAEDLPGASFAGQQETFLNIKGESHLIHKIRECWASLFTERAIFYRHSQGFDHAKVGLAAVVQRMVESDKSGIAFSIDPVTNDKNKLVIEAIFGLGEFIVQGKVTPDHYEVDKKSMLILKKEPHYQTSKLVKSGISNKEIKLGKKIGSIVKLSDQEIIRLAFLVKDIEKHYYFPQDIEWAIRGDQVYIVQSRPITTINSKSQTLNPKQIQSSNIFGLGNSKLELPLLSGSPASPGIAVGPAKVIFSPWEIDKIRKGDILVAPLTNPDFVPAMKRAAGIVTEKGGRTSHAAIVSRELGVPAVVGAEKATKILKNEMIVTVNGLSGEIFKGSVQPSLKSAINKPIISKTKKHTLTHIYVNLAEPEEAEKVSKMHVDGVGLLRAEFMIAELGVHPKEYIKEKKETIFINYLTKNILKFVKAFHPRPVVYRATDFKTNEYRNLKGGKYFEPDEENPMIGFRGASRYIANPDVFSLELKAIKNIFDLGYRNLQLMIPFVRVPWELIKIKDIIKKYGLFAYSEFKLLIMVEVPSCALNLEEFIRIGIDGVSIGSNDLTMMLLGVDRDNQEVSNIYEERNPVVVAVLENIIKTSKKYGITASICGQAPSDYPEIVEKLVKSGTTSISVNIDAIERTRELVYEIERKIYKK